MIVVLDGPSGSGKSTLAKEIAKAFGWAYFDTGAMYRSVCWYLIENNVSFEDQQKIKEKLAQFHFEIKGQGHDVQFFVNDQNVTDKIRTNEINKKVSVISAYPFVREQLVKQQRSFGQNRDAVFEGRDMGTVVFPQADFKFFLKADTSVRAKRRYEQLCELYPSKQFNLKEIEEDLIKRDEIDSSRECSPLKQAEDAILLDSSHLTVQELLDKIKTLIERSAK